MSVEKMKQDILNSPMAEVRGTERIKRMLERHDELFIKRLYQLMVEDEEIAMMGQNHQACLNHMTIVIHY